MAGVATPRKRRAAWAAALVCWVAFIWGHSLVAGPESSHESGFFVALLRPLFWAVGVHDADLMSFLVRKGAHFSEYFVLGLLASQNASLWTEGLGRRSRLIVVASTAVPFIDEWIQLSVPGRSGMPQDVALDLWGLVTGLMGFLLAWAAHRIFQSR